MIVTTHISAQMELMFASETSHKTSFPFPSCSRQYTKIHNTSEQWIGLYWYIYIFVFITNRVFPVYSPCFSVNKRRNHRSPRHSHHHIQLTRLASHAEFHGFDNQFTSFTSMECHKKHRALIASSWPPDVHLILPPAPNDLLVAFSSSFFYIFLWYL